MMKPQQLFKKLLPLFILACIGVLFHLTARFCESKTDGFSIAFIHSDLTYNPAWETIPRVIQNLASGNVGASDLQQAKPFAKQGMCKHMPDAANCKDEDADDANGQILNHPGYTSIPEKTSQELKKVFAQKFKYLDCGGQSFVFVSEDHQYVIKFFKHRHFRKPYSFLLRMPLPGILELSRLCKLNKALFKLKRDFTSYKLAYDELQEETGLIYLHLNKGTDLNQSIQIVDKIGIEHTVDLDNIEFIVQRRAQLLYSRIHELMEKGDIHGAKQVLHAILEVIVSRCKKGIFDEDPRIHNNLGLLDQKAIFIDIGRFVHDQNRTDPSVYIKDLKAITGKRFRPWLERTYPELVIDLDEMIHQLEKQCEDFYTQSDSKFGQWYTEITSKGGQRTGLKAAAN